MSDAITISAAGQTASVQTAASPTAAGVTAAGTTAAGVTPAGGAAAARPSVITLAIREKAALYAAYMPFIQGGALFVPSTRSANLGDDLYLILSLLDDPTKYAVPGKVVWITPAGSTGRQQGLGIQFASSEAGEQARSRIEEMIGGALKSTRPTNTI